MKKQKPHKQIKALDAEIAKLQNSLPNLDLKEFEATCERIYQLEIKRFNCSIRLKKSNHYQPIKF